MQKAYSGKQPILIGPIIRGTSAVYAPHTIGWIQKERHGWVESETNTVHKTRVAAARALYKQQFYQRVQELQITIKKRSGAICRHVQRMKRADNEISQETINH